MESFKLLNFEEKVKNRESLEFNIAVASSAMRRKWKNTQMNWQEFLGRISRTTRTQETCQEYKAMPKSQKDRIKDVGGFVGGFLKNGSRKSENVQSRQLLTLDIDFPEDGLLDKLEKLGWEMAVYSTHSHTVERGRYRLIAPLDRPCYSDEYQAVARMVAYKIGIEQFDDTTYQANRLMYWPSTSRDGEFIFKHLPGVLLTVDGVLGEYVNWKDTTSWPQSEREHGLVQRLIKKQEDPLIKEGIVGTFCRAYSIPEAIKTFLTEEYTTTDDPNRYTYTKGSTFGGAVVYEDKFIYSHHDTDPASMQLCNAFDLVRLHLYGALDENSAATGTGLPSFQAMQTLAGNDAKVKEALFNESQEKQKDLLAMFSEGEGGNSDLTWLESLDVTSKGKYKSTTNNILLILTHDDSLKDCYAYDLLKNRAVKVGKTPWRTASGDLWSDTDDAGLRHYLETVYEITGGNRINDAFRLALAKREMDPVKDYLSELSWDGVERVDRLLIDYLGAEDSDYAKFIIRKTLVAAVKRAFEPGCKFDNMLVLSGPQGIGKSTIIKLLGREWYSDSIITVNGKDAYEQLNGVWIGEMGELTATKKADIESIKHFLSKQVDSYRPAYGVHKVDFARRGIIIGTTNDTEFLRDKTGNRRFWPIAVGCTPPIRSVFTLKDKDIDQIWAEAVELYRRGEKVYLNEKQYKEATIHQQAFAEEDVRAGLVREYLDIPVPKDWYTKSLYDRRTYIQSDDFLGMEDTTGKKRDKICALEIYNELFGGDIKKLTPRDTRQIKDILRSIPGWKEAKSSMRFGTGYGKQRGFIRIDEEEEE